MLVSCIMPTRGRPDYAPMAVAAFQAQTYEPRQLLILDDADDPSFPTAPMGDSRIRYLRNRSRLSIPAKRNQCCMVAQGEIVATWDDDDWSDPQRLNHQVDLLRSSGKSVTGYSTCLFINEQGHWGRWRNNTGFVYAIGTSLTYWKSWWEHHRFREELAIGEDSAFIVEANDYDEVVTAEGRGMIVGRVHSRCTSPKAFESYDPIDNSSIPALFLKACKPDA